MMCSVKYNVLSRSVIVSFNTSCIAVLFRYMELEMAEPFLLFYWVIRQFHWTLLMIDGIKRHSVSLMLRMLKWQLFDWTRICSIDEDDLDEEMSENEAPKVKKKKKAKKSSRESKGSKRNRSRREVMAFSVGMWGCCLQYLYECSISCPYVMDYKHPPLTLA